MQRLQYKYTTTQDHTFELGVEYSGNPISITQKSTGKVLAHLSPNGVLVVYKGYSWDGCSPKWQGDFLGKQLILGTWDGVEQYYPSIDETCQQLKYPSLIHDVLCQMYHNIHHYHFYTRKDIDIIFCNKMKSWGVSYFQRKLYYYSVRSYAKIVYRGYE